METETISLKGILLMQQQQELNIKMSNIFAFGDSIMKGIVTDPTQICEGTIKYKISDKSFVSRCEHDLGRPIDNLSRFGSTILGGLKYLERHFSEIQRGDTVVLEFGGNDCNFDWKAIATEPDKEHLPYTTLSNFRKIYTSIIEKVFSLGAQPVMLSLPVLDSQKFFYHVSQGLNADNILHWLGGDVNHINNWHEQYNLEIFKLGARLNVPVIDITSIFLEKPNLSELYCPDGMHPNEAGHALIAEAIMKFQL